MHNILSKLAHFITKKYKLILIIFVLISIGAGYSAYHIDLKLDLVELLPENFPSVKAYNRMLDKFGAVGYVITVVESDDPETNKKFVTDFANSLQKSKDELKIKYVDYRLPIDFIEKHSLLFIDYDDLQEIYKRLKKKIKQEKWKNNPFNLGLRRQKEVTFDDLAEKYSSGRIKEFYSSEDEKSVLMLIKSTVPSADAKAAKELVEGIQAKERELDPKSYADDLSVQYTGLYVKKWDDTKVINSDLRITALIALLLVVLSLLIFLRHPVSVVSLTIPLLVAVVLTFGITALPFVLGYINILTGFIVSILFGLGIDMGIHFLTVYGSERYKGSTPEESVIYTLDNIGFPMFTAAMTTACAFAVLLISDFKAFYEFGFIAAIGMVSCYITTLFLLPSLLIFIEKHTPFRLDKKPPRASTSPLLKGFTRFVFRYKIPVVLISFVLIIFSVIFIPDIGFEYDFTKILGSDMPSYKLEERLQHDVMKMSFTPAIVIADDPQQERKLYNILDEKVEKGKDSVIFEMLKEYTDHASTEFTEKIPDKKIFEKVTKSLPKIFAENPLPEAFLHKYVFDLSANLLDNYYDKAYVQKVMHDIIDKNFTSTIDFVLGLPTYIPDKQKKKIRVLHKIDKLLKKNDKYLKNLLPEEEEQLDDIKKRLKADVITLEKVPYEITMTYEGIDPNAPERFLQVYPKNSISLSDALDLKRFAKEINNIPVGKGKSISASGEMLIMSDILRLIEGEAGLILGCVIALVFVLVFILIRKLKDTLLVLVPLFIGMLIMMLAMVIFNVKFNFFNVIVIPIILGIGIDNGVYIYYRYRKCKTQEEVINTFGESLGAVSMSSLTTMFGFSALMFATHRGLSTIGTVADLGIGFALITSITLLPAILRLTIKKKS